MKSLWKFCAAILAAGFVSATALAADASPTGTWKWMQPGRDGGQATERKIQLELKDGKLTGKMLGFEGPQGQIPDAPISDGSFKDGTVAFSIVRDFGGNSFTIKYQGKLEGDAIKGTSEFPGFNGGEPTKRDWNPTRVK
jgi:hypothetical protein